MEVESVERNEELDTQREIEKQQALQRCKAQNIGSCFLSLSNSCHHHPVTSCPLNPKPHLSGAYLAEELLEGRRDSLCSSRHMPQGCPIQGHIGEDVGLLDCPEAHGMSF